MAHVAVIARVRNRPGRNAELVAALRELIAQVHDEPGTLRYVMHQDAADPDQIWFYELYESAEAVEAHNTAEAMRAFLPRAAGLIDGTPEIVRLIPVVGKDDGLG